MNEDPFACDGVQPRSGTAGISYTRRYTDWLRDRQTFEMVGLAVVVGVLAGSEAAGRQVSDLTLPEECILVSVTRQGRTLVPHGDTPLYPGDRVVAVCTPENERALRALVEVPR